MATVAEAPLFKYLAFDASHRLNDCTTSDMTERSDGTLRHLTYLREGSACVIAGLPRYLTDTFFCSRS